MWFILSLIAGFADALRDAASKKFSRDLPTVLISFSYALIPTILLLPFLFKHLPETLPPSFYRYLAVTTVLHSFGGLILVRALKLGELSLSAPLTAFSPVFLLGIAPFITGDAPTMNGIIGSCLVVFGSYLLNLSQTKLGFWAPIRALVSNPAPRLMLIHAFMWSITGSIDRAALKEFELLFWGPAQMLAITLVYLPFAIFCRHGSAVNNSVRQGRAVLTIGGFNALSYLTYLFALTLAPVYFVVCVKRCSILFSIILGKHLFNEGNSAERLFGATLMIAGIAVICIQ